jgi:hypothetical protein
VLADGRNGREHGIDFPDTDTVARHAMTRFIDRSFCKGRADATPAPCVGRARMRHARAKRCKNYR